MNPAIGRGRVSELQLTPEQEVAVEDAIAANVAVQIFRQSRLLEEQNPELARAAASGGCNVITNCSSCSKVAE